MMKDTPEGQTQSTCPHGSFVGGEIDPPCHLCTIEALLRERVELKKSVEFWASHIPTDAYVDAIAASQAREQQLREALSDLREEAQSAGFGVLRETLVPYPVAGGARTVKNHQQVAAFDKALVALALPHDDTALTQWGAKLLRDAANYREPDLAFHLIRMADELSHE